MSIFEVDARDPIGDHGQQFIGNGAQMPGDFMDVQMWTQDFHRGSDGVGLVESHQGEVHADAADVGAILAFDVGAGALMVSEQSIRIADAQGTDPFILCGGVGSAIADGLVGAHAFHFLKGRHQRHDRFEVDIIIGITIERQADANGIAAWGGEVDGGAGVGAVDPFEGSVELIQQTDKQVVLGLRLWTVGFIAGSEMGEDAFGQDAFAIQNLERVLGLLDLDPIAVQTGVDFQMNT